MSAVLRNIAHLAIAKSCAIHELDRKVHSRSGCASSPLARQRRLMALAEVGEVWGIGRRLSTRLGAMGITTALQLADYDHKTLRRLFSINVERTARELTGEGCFALDDGPEPKKMIAATRSFGQRIYDLAGLEEAVATYASRAAEKLRAQQQYCQLLQVFIRSSAFAHGSPPGELLVVT